MNFSFVAAAAENDVYRLQQLQNCEHANGNACEALKYAIEYDAVCSVRWLLSNFQCLLSSSFLLSMCDLACNYKASTKVLECLLNALLETLSWRDVAQFMDQHWCVSENCIRMHEVHDQMNVSEAGKLEGWEIVNLSATDCRVVY